MKQTVDFTDEYPRFTEDMKDTRTILVPGMLPWHFELIVHIMELEGYHAEILCNEGRKVIDEGLKHVHNDTCYPALCVIGQYLDALKSGKYDPDRCAVLITQTGGGCRASNYLPLIRKALKAEFPQVPVLSLNFSGLEKDSGLKLGVKLLRRYGYAVLYGDLVMTCFHQTKPYEKEEGACERVRDEVVAALKQSFDDGSFCRLKRYTSYILERFGAVPVLERNKLRVGIVGEIYVKYAPLGNSHLEDFLLAEGCEPVVPSLADFILYCLANNLNDAKFYGRRSIATPAFRLAYRWFYGKQKKVISIMKESRFDPLHDFEELRAYADRVISQGVKMGEGWLIPAEMASLAHAGVGNIICAQPFGCLPNHVAGKGAIRAVKELFPEANIAPIDYDPSASRVNQENRIKLMLAAARERR